MQIKYQIEIQNEAIIQNLKKLTNQIYKLLPNREEGIDWKKPLTTILEEFAGMNRLFLNSHSLLFTLLCKLEGLFTLDDDKDGENKNFLIFRKTIFECLSLVNDLVKICF